jgi:iron complex transport system substrate-binding protein
MRICSLLPSATEILYALGLGDSVVGITHECDFPPEVSGKRVVVRSRLPHTNDPAEIDHLVREFTHRGESIYRVDADALRELDPDLIVTQDLCHVCAASPDDLASALSVLLRMPRVLSLNPHSLADVWNDIRTVGAATGRDAEAQAVVQELTAKVDAIVRVVANASSGAPRPRVACLEWLDPPFNGGHWVPEMVALAGGEDVLGRAGEPSISLDWADIIRKAPEVIIVMPCGYDAKHAAAEFAEIKLPAGWASLPAVKQGRVFASDANAYFSRPGPRLADGVAVLAAAINPSAAIPHLPAGALHPLVRTSTASV